MLVPTLRLVGVETCLGAGTGAGTVAVAAVTSFSKTYVIRVLVSSLKLNKKAGTFKRPLNWKGYQIFVLTLSLLKSCLDSV